MLAIKAPGAESFIPLPNTVIQDANTRNRFLYGFQMVWICSEAWPGGESEEWGSASEDLDRNLSSPAFAGILGDGSTMETGSISRSTRGSASRGKLSRADFFEWIGGGLGILPDWMEMVAAKLEVDMMTALFGETNERNLRIKIRILTEETNCRHVVTLFTGE